MDVVGFSVLFGSLIGFGLGMALLVVRILYVASEDFRRTAWEDGRDYARRSARPGAAAEYEPGLRADRAGLAVAVPSFLVLLLVVAPAAADSALQWLWSVDGPDARHGEMRHYAGGMFWLAVILWGAVHASVEIYKIVAGLRVPGPDPLR